MGAVFAYGYGKCFFDNIGKVSVADQIQNVIDRDQKKWGQSYHGIKCASIDDIAINDTDSIILFLDNPKNIIDVTVNLSGKGLKCSHYKEFITTSKNTTETLKYIPIPKVLHDNRLLEGKNAMVFGGTSGIGRSIVEKFAEHGCNVVAVGRNVEALKEVEQQCKCSSAQIDISEFNNLERKIDDVINNQLDGRIDILVNGAGVISEKPFFDITNDDYDLIMNTNLKGLFFASQIVSKYMVKNEDDIKGHILNISSASSIRPAWTPYQISKWGVKGFTEGLADVLLKKGIIVNAIAPGPVATKMLGKEDSQDIYRKNQPSQRYAMPSEVSDWAVFLVSDLGNLVVGDSIFLSGGSAILSKHR